MVKAKWGIKRSCLGCGAHFYDLKRSPIVCPKCGVEFDPVVSNKPTRTRSAPEVEKAPVVEKPPAVETGTDDAKSEEDDSDAVAAVENDGDDEAVIEDVSELGEDKDDMFEVMDNVKEEKDDTA